MVSRFITPICTDGLIRYVTGIYIKSQIQYDYAVIAEGVCWLLSEILMAERDRRYHEIVYDKQALRDNFLFILPELQPYLTVAVWERLLKKFFSIKQLYQIQTVDRVEYKGSLFIVVHYRQKVGEWELLQSR